LQWFAKLHQLLLAISIYDVDRLDTFRAADNFDFLGPPDHVIKAIHGDLYEISFGIISDPEQLQIIDFYLAADFEGPNFDTHMFAIDAL
jgi:hypothetical protein